MRRYNDRSNVPADWGNMYKSIANGPKVENQVSRASYIPARVLEDDERPNKLSRNIKYVENLPLYIQNRLAAKI